jgi:hypothetical protein
MLLLLLPPALASGVVTSHARLVDHQCGVYGEAARADWPTVAVSVPAEALAVEPGFVALDAQWVTAQLGGLYVMGATHLAVDEPLQITGPMPGTLTVARTRRRFDEEDGMGAEWCTTVEKVQVTVTLEGVEPVWSFSASEDNARVRVDGWCS